jgi:CheY-like chemotaxis protein
MKTIKPILLVEDDSVDALTVQRAWQELKIANQLETVGNGEEALLRLRDLAREKPSIILLDLNMPRMNGLEFLTIIKDDPKLKRIPVIILTTSKAKSDVKGGFSRGAAGYIVKPADYGSLLKVMQTISRYWSLSELSPV